MPPAPTLKLGLIGDNIAASRSPWLHRCAGRLAGLDVTYDRLVPPELGQDFATVLAGARAGGYRGVNVTYPYKERVVAEVTVPDPMVRAMGAVNTVVFAKTGPQGHNTDYTGFMAAYRAVRGDRAPGTVCLIGTGGVGRAVGFGLLGLGAAAVRCTDVDADKARALAAALAAPGTATRIEVSADAAAAARGADGLVNCTPLGMAGIGGSALGAAHMRGARWAFDAVYTPVDTQFLTDAAAAGLEVVSGYELFFGQGLDAWRIFSGRPVDAAALRAAVAEPED